VIVEDQKFDGAQYTMQYELLRSQVIGPSENRSGTADQLRGVGLALLLSEGMPGWLRNVAVALAPRAGDSPATHDASLQSTAAPRLPDTQRHEITALLASLVLSTLPIANKSSKEGCRSWQ
jgi:hypothetical protein